MNDAASGKFATHGAQLFKGAVRARLGDLDIALSAVPQGQAGVRLHGFKELVPLLISTGCVGLLAAQVLGRRATPVRAILFDKSPQNNWALAWHQDRTICVRQKREAPGFGPWTVKGGMVHVAPPFDLLARMVTMRVHLDDVPACNAPLLIAPGSHKSGKVPEDQIDEVVRRCGIAMCLAKAGDVWLYATPILHASKVASNPARRRVLQIDYAAEDLPHQLEWQGI